MNIEIILQRTNRPQFLQRQGISHGNIACRPFKLPSLSSVFAANLSLIWLHFSRSVVKGNFNATVLWITTGKIPLMKKHILLQSSKAV